MSNTVTERLLILQADTFAAYRATHLAHWNIRGAESTSLHALFNDQYDELFRAIDPIAERQLELQTLVPLGWEARTSIELGSDLCSPDYRVVLSALVSINECVINSAIYVQQAAETADDQATLNLIADRIRAHQHIIYRLTAPLRK